MEESAGFCIKSTNLFMCKQVELHVTDVNIKRKIILPYNFYAVLMKFVYFGSQTSDWKFPLVFEKMLNLGIWKFYIFLLLVLTGVFIIKIKTLMKLGFQIICIQFYMVVFLRKNISYVHKFEYYRLVSSNYCQCSNNRT